MYMFCMFYTYVLNQKRKRNCFMFSVYSLHSMSWCARAFSSSLRFFLFYISWRAADADTSRQIAIGNFLSAFVFVEMIFWKSVFPSFRSYFIHIHTNSHMHEYVRESDRRTRTHAHTHTIRTIHSIFYINTADTSTYPLVNTNYVLCM